MLLPMTPLVPDSYPSTVSQQEVVPKPRVKLFLMRDASSSIAYRKIL